MVLRKTLDVIYRAVLKKDTPLLNQEYHLWYSIKMAETLIQRGEPIPRYRMRCGREVSSTYVSATKKHNCEWDDMEYLGVGAWVGPKPRNPDRVLLSDLLMQAHSTYFESDDSPISPST